MEGSQNRTQVKVILRSQIKKKAILEKCNRSGEGYVHLSTTKPNEFRILCRAIFPNTFPFQLSSLDSKSDFLPYLIADSE